jgi:hypothetical protein
MKAPPPSVDVRAGFVVERDERLIALLDDPKFVDMFWDAYRMVPVTDDPVERVRMLTKEYWMEYYSQFRFTSRDGQQPVRFMIAGDAVLDGRLVLRGPHLATDGEE